MTPVMSDEDAEMNIGYLYEDEEEVLLKESRVHYMMQICDYDACEVLCREKFSFIIYLLTKGVSFSFDISYRPYLSLLVTQTKCK